MNCKACGKKVNNRGKNKRDAHGRFISSAQSNSDTICWSFTLPETIIINGVRYVKEVIA